MKIGTKVVVSYYLNIFSTKQILTLGYHYAKIDH